MESKKREQKGATKMMLKETSKIAIEQSLKLQSEYSDSIPATFGQRNSSLKRSCSSIDEINRQNDPDSDIKFECTCKGQNGEAYVINNLESFKKHQDCPDLKAKYGDLISAFNKVIEQASASIHLLNSKSEDAN